MSETDTGGRPVEHGMRSITLWAGQLPQEEREHLRQLIELHQNHGPSGIMRRRALVLGVMLHRLEGTLANNPANIQSSGTLYRQLVEAERRAWVAADDLDNDEGSVFDLAQDG